VTSLKVVRVQVGLVLVSLLVTVVAVFDDWVKKISPDVVALFITSDTADGHDERMSWVVNTSLDGHIKCVTVWCFDITQLSVHLLGEHFGHVVVVLGEVGVVLIGGVFLLSHPCC